MVLSRTVFAKPDDYGAPARDETMKKGPGSPKGENMPPAGGESMAPADSARKPPPPKGSAAGEPSEKRD